MLPIQNQFIILLPTSIQAPPQMVILCLNLFFFTTTLLFHPNAVTKPSNSVLALG